MAQKETFGFLIEKAQELGCTASALILADKVVVDEREKLGKAGVGPR